MQENEEVLVKPSEIHSAFSKLILFIEQISHGLQSLFKGFVEFVARPEVKASIASLQEHPQVLRERIAVRRNMLRHGLVPSNMIISWADRRTAARVKLSTQESSNNVRIAPAVPSHNNRESGYRFD